MVLLALSCAEALGQAAPNGSSLLPDQVQTPAVPTQPAPSEAPSGNSTSSSLPPSTGPTGPVAHTISVTFDYDFDQTPACTAEIKRRCVQQFVVYDISSGAKHAYQIGRVDLPDHPYGQKRGIAGKTDPHVFESGKHLIAVAAREPEPQPYPVESTTAGCSSCATWVSIP
ncbi:MAG TPA: hypothetical protein VEJ45_05385 [Candidatus Acidoferrales bacterium]|nr:hypothetical protein [Candidatus Acidoferrales bacterium]